MPVWGYFAIGFVIVALVLLTARRNQVAYHEDPIDYGVDFRTVLETVEPALEELREALRDGDEQPLSRAAAAARSRIHANISNLDRLGFPDSVSETERELLTDLRLKLRQAMENYEWAARIAETTDLIENEGLRRAFDSLVASGDQLCFDCRLQLVGLGPAAADA
jgi:hypothetical protein